MGVGGWRLQGRGEIVEIDASVAAALPKWIAVLNGLILKSSFFHLFHQKTDLRWNVLVLLIKEKRRRYFNWGGEWEGETAQAVFTPSRPEKPGRKSQRKKPSAFAEDAKPDMCCEGGFYIFSF